MTWMLSCAIKAALVLAASGLGATLCRRSTLDLALVAAEVERRTAVFDTASTR